MSLFPRIIPIQCFSIYSGVKVYTEKFRWNPFYKQSNVEAIESAVSPGDKVVIVGSGLGVTTVQAAHEAGEEGSIIAYEASSTQLQRTVLATIVNEVYTRCTINHSIVSHAVETRGPTNTAGTVEPSILPLCDVIEMDCEGAEANILPELQDPPAKLIIETHPSQYSQNIDIKSIIHDRGYQILKEWDDPREGQVIYAKQKIRNSSV